jgi:hypothetical protein
MKAARGEAFTTTRRYALSRMDSLRCEERFSPRRRGVKWTLPMVRRHLQQILLLRIGSCPLCNRPVDRRSAPQAESRL